jgi:hypothetical protein
VNSLSFLATYYFQGFFTVLINNSVIRQKVILSMSEISKEREGVDGQKNMFELTVVELRHV